MKLKSLLCVCALLTAAAAPAANAAIITTTYQGVISDASMPNPGFDYSDTFGLFGPVGASLAGDAITVVCTTNDATPGVDYRANFILGFAAANPVSAVVTINGVSQTFSPPGAGDGFLGVGADPNGITAFTDVASIPGLAEEAVFASMTARIWRRGRTFTMSSPTCAHPRPVSVTAIWNLPRGPSPMTPSSRRRST